LISHDIEIWRESVLETLPDEFMSVPDFSRSWVALLLEHKRLIKLLTILYTMLEQNASLEALIQFKHKLLAEMGTASEKLIKILPFNSFEAVGEFLSTHIALIIGFYPLIDLAPKQKEAMEVVGMDTTPEFNSGMLIRATESLLQGLTDNKKTI
jgi:hypothetical protein